MIAVTATDLLAYAFAFAIVVLSLVLIAVRPSALRVASGVVGLVLVADVSLYASTGTFECEPQCTWAQELSAGALLPLAGLFAALLVGAVLQLLLARRR